MKRFNKALGSKRTQKVLIVMPAYNAARTIDRTIADIPLLYREYIYLVDDHSTDNTLDVAKKHNIRIFQHPHNVGYGGNQKTCYWEALKRNFDVIVMLHPDYQYDAKRLPDMVEPILKKRFDIMIGSRIRTRAEALAGGMPLVKYLLNRVFTVLENVVLGVNLSEHMSGFRAYSRHVLQVIPFQRFSNDFVFDQQFIMSAVSFGFRIGETPVPVRYFSQASSIGFLRGMKFLAETLWYLCLYIFHVTGLKSSALYSR